MGVQSIHPVKIFYCYTHEDNALREQLEKHLSPLRRLRDITGWFDGNIQVGGERERESKEQLDRASIILLLISANFIASDYCYTVEMMHALERHRAGTACVIPILLRPVDWERTPFGELSPLPTNRIPVTEWANPDAAWLNITQGISTVVRELLPKQFLSLQDTDILYTEQGSLSGQAIGENRAKYLLGKLIGEGGFSQVYKAEHLLIERKQAVKVLQEHHFRKPEFRERFLREARIVASLDHPNIIHLDDFWVEPSQAFLVMPYISGGTLQDILEKQQGFLEQDQIIVYLEQICSALDYAHTQKIAHLDLKPLNILVHENGHLLLSDFGLAHVMKDGAMERRSSLEAGTPHYMAPEHINGILDTRSDLFSLGVILYQMLVGRLPFDGQALGTILMRNMTELPSNVRALRPELSQAVEDVVAKALAKQPEQRYQTAKEFLMAFKNTLGTQHNPQVESLRVANPPVTTSTLLPKRRTSLKKRAIVAIPLIIIILLISTSPGNSSFLSFQNSDHRLISHLSAYDNAIAIQGIQFGFDAQHTRNNPFERLLSPTTVSKLKTAWSSEPTGNNIGSSPAVANGIVYVGSDDGKLYAYRADGCGNAQIICAPLWSSEPTGNNIGSSPAVADGIVYVGSLDHKLHAYRADGCGNAQIICAPLWSSEPTGSYLISSPAVANGIVYVGSHDHKLYAYRANGCGNAQIICAPLWSSEPTGSYIDSSPAVADGIVYVSSYDYKLYAYPAGGCGNGRSTCAPLWSSESTNGSIFSSPAVANGIVYVGSVDHKLHAYRADGCGQIICAPLWSSVPTGSYINSSPAVADGIVYVGSDDHKLYAYRADGCGNGRSMCVPLWSSDPTNGSIFSSPVVADGIVYVGSNDHQLYAYQAGGCSNGQSTCAPLWSSDPTGGAVRSSPAIANGVVYVGSDDHKLYSFHF